MMDIELPVRKNRLLIWAIGLLVCLLVPLKVFAQESPSPSPSPSASESHSPSPSASTTPSPTPSPSPSPAATQGSSSSPSPSATSAVGAASPSVSPVAKKEVLGAATALGSTSAESDFIKWLAVLGVGVVTLIIGLRLVRSHAEE